MAEPLKDLTLIEPASPEALFPHEPIWPWATAAFLFLILSIWIARRIFRRKIAPPTDPRDLAYREALHSLTTLNADDARDAATRCSLVLRHYLARVANDPALFETHEEFITRKDSLQSLSPHQRDAAERTFLRLANLKYSPHSADEPTSTILTESRSLLETLHTGKSA